MRPEIWAFGLVPAVDLRRDLQLLIVLELPMWTRLNTIYFSRDS